VKVPRGRGLASEAKNLCDAVVANFSFVDHRLLPRAFHTKARSHFTIAAPIGQLGFRFYRCRKPGKWPIMIAGFHGIFYTCTKQTKIPANCFYVRLSGGICEIFIPQWPIYTAGFAVYIT
jgi:hypothetical protein